MTDTLFFFILVLIKPLHNVKPLYHFTVKSFILISQMMYNRCKSFTHFFSNNIHGKFVAIKWIENIPF